MNIQILIESEGYPSVSVLNILHILLKGNSQFLYVQIVVLSKVLMFSNYQKKLLLVSMMVSKSAVQKSKTYILIFVHGIFLNLSVKEMTEWLWF